MDTAMDTANIVRHFRQILIWPLQLDPLPASSGFQNHWEPLACAGDDCPWREVEDEFTADPREFSERHYFEFVNFLPFVQRFLYGEGVSQQAGAAGRKSPIRTFRHRSIATAKLTLRPGGAPLELKVAHADLYFFHDIDIAILNLEIHADDLPLEKALETLDGFRRAYPTCWDSSGEATRCPARVEFLGRDGTTLGVSDYEKRDDYLSFVCRHRTPRVAAHWQALLRPLTLAHCTGEPTHGSYKLIEDDRIPAMTYLGFADPRLLTRGDFVRMAFGSRKGQLAGLPYGSRFLEDFEARYCYDRYWDQTGNEAWMGARYLCTGAMFTLAGNANDPFFSNAETGLLGQFRHQFFLLGLIVHFHKAALLMLSDRLSLAVNHLDPGNPGSVRAFQREVRHDLEIFLRFNHRYWFHEISNQLQMRDLHRLWATHLGTDALYSEVHREVHDINQYLDSARAKKLADIGVRLGVVATFGFVGVFVTGFFGMNVFSFGEGPLEIRTLVFLLVLALATGLTFYTISISKPLANFLDALSAERLSWAQKFGALREIWRKPRGDKN